MPTLETDYLVVGAGATAMAFVDELLHQDARAEIVMVDRRASPGGHWVDAYPFVTLHQPALYYGVNSEPLGDGGRDLASKGQILGYYDRVLRKLFRTGRLTFLPQTEFLGDGQLRSLAAPGLEHEVTVRRRVVDTTYSEVTIPATRAPLYDVDEDTTVVPINALASLERPWSRYVVIGAGKTGMDAILYLLRLGVAPAAITWVKSREAWLVNREHTYPKGFVGSVREQVRLTLESSSVEEIFLGWEAFGTSLRLDPSTMPEVYRCATVSPEEFAALKTIDNVVRLGRVSRVARDHIELRDGTIDVDDDTLFVDCTADGLTKRPAVPIFSPGRITMQPVNVCQPTFSAALVAKVETMFDDDGMKNAHAGPVPPPEVAHDLLDGMYGAFSNLDHWRRSLPGWVFRSRLNVGSHAGLWANISFGTFVLRRYDELMSKLIELGGRPAIPPAIR